MQSLVTELASMAADLGGQRQSIVAPPPWWPSAFPSPEVTAAVVLGMLVFAAVAAVVIVRVVVPVGVRVVGAVRQMWRRAAPKSAFGKVMTIFCLLLVVVTAPTLVTLVDAKGALADTAAGTGVIAEMEGDTVEYTAPTSGGEVDSRETTLPRPSPDRDGDRLLDGWERAGETPDGVPLPNASVGRKDIYLQVVYGDGVSPLDESERESLREIWARMPVENPDGSTGITLHLVDERRLDREVRVYEPGKELIRERYTGSYLDGAECVYYQTTFGEITHPNLGGRAALGGYVSMVDGGDTVVRNGRSNRVAYLTHELLHNTAGRVEGRPHTRSGWLAPTYDGTNGELSEATAADLNEGFALDGHAERTVCAEN